MPRGACFTFSVGCPLHEHKKHAIVGTFFVFGTFQPFPPVPIRHRRDDTKGWLGGDEDVSVWQWQGWGWAQRPISAKGSFFLLLHLYLLTPTLSSPAVPPPPVMILFVTLKFLYFHLSCDTTTWPITFITTTCPSWWPPLLQLCSLLMPLTLIPIGSWLLPLIIPQLWPLPITLSTTSDRAYHLFYH